MNPAAPAVDAAAAQELFRGPKRLRWALPVLRALPVPLARGLVTSMTVANGLMRPARLRSALAWGQAHATARQGRWSLALGTLAYHGQFVADEVMLGTLDDGRPVTIEGKAHLDALHGRGAALLGFHLGPPKAALRLRTLGYHVYFTGRMDQPERSAQTPALLSDAGGVSFPGGAPAGRAEALHQLHTLIRRGALVYLTGDGPFGRELFGIDLPGARLSVRPGWYALRRAGATVLPIQSALVDGRPTLRILPPLPPVLPSQADDLRLCQELLTGHVADYVRRHPAQCRWLAMPRWARNPGEGRAR